MADWKRILNPWREMRRLELANSALMQRCEDLWERADRAEGEAFRKASEHYYQRSRMVEEQLRRTQEQLVDVTSLTPRAAAIVAGDQTDLPIGRKPGYFTGRFIG